MELVLIDAYPIVAFGPPLILLNQARGEELLWMKLPQMLSRNSAERQFDASGRGDGAVDKQLASSNRVHQIIAAKLD